MPQGRSRPSCNGWVALVAAQASARNFLFLATGPPLLRQLACCTRGGASGYVEPITPPVEPFHILAQQLLALALQEGHIGRTQWADWIGRVPAFSAMSPEDTNAVLAHMVKQGLLFDDAGLLSIGPEGERSFGYRNFKEIFSVFTSPPLFTVLHGRAELGQVHDASFLVRGGREPVLLLAGRSWRVTNLDWPRRLAYVEPSEMPGRSQWLGSPGALHFDLCRAIRRVLVTGHCPASLSARAADRLANLQRDFPWLVDDATTIVRDPDGDIRWWTFAGLRSNAAVSAALGAATTGTTAVRQLHSSTSTRCQPPRR